ncbi:unnamed protein product [Sphagnum compactum]
MQEVRDLLLLLLTPPKKVTNFVLPVQLARRKFHCADISGGCLGPSRSPAAQGACLFKDSLSPLQGGSQAAAAMIKGSRVQTQPGVVLC